MKKKEKDNKLKEEKSYTMAKIVNCPVSVNIRAKPTINSESVKVLRNGDIVRILDVNATHSYYKVCMNSNSSVVGYVPFEYCAKLEDIPMQGA